MRQDEGIQRKRERMRVHRERDRMMAFREREKAKASNGLLYFGHRP